MGHAAAGLAQAVFLAAALRGVNGFVHRHDDVSHGDVGRLAGQRIATARAARGFHEFVAAQLAEKLLQIGQRNLLALADGGQRDRAVVLAQCQVNHRGDRKTAFGCKTHYELLQSGLFVRYRNLGLAPCHAELSLRPYSNLLKGSEPFFQ